MTPRPLSIILDALIVAAAVGVICLALAGCHSLIPHFGTDNAVTLHPPATTPREAATNKLLIPGVLLGIGGLVALFMLPALHGSYAVALGGALMVGASYVLPRIDALVGQGAQLLWYAGVAGLVLGGLWFWKRRETAETKREPKQ